jgi:hypothetical protein
MYLSDKIDFLIEKLKENCYFDNVKIIKSYPYSKKDTRLSKTVVAVSPSKIEAQNISIGNDTLYGDYSVDFDVFIPIQSGSPVDSSVIEQIVVTLSECQPKSVYVSEISVNNSISCCLAKCTFTFNGKIEIGG